MDLKNWKKNITLFMIGQGLSLIGSTLVYYAILWHITLKTGSGIMMMLLTIAQTIPMFIISPFGGVWADRYNKKHLINISDAAIAVVTLVMAIFFSLGYEYVALLLVCTIMRSFGQGVQTPAVNALIPELVPKENLTKINGINGSVQSLAMFVSPMFAGILLSFMSITSILFIDVVTAIIGISILYFFVKVKPVEKQETKINYFSDLKEGIVYAKKHSFIKKFLIIGAIFNIMMAPAATLTPLQVSLDFGTEVWRLTVVEMVFFVGSMLSGVVIGIWGGFKNKSHTMAFAMGVSGIGIAILGLVTNFWVYVVCMGIVGLLMMMANPPMMAILQSNIEEKYMGRVFSLLVMMSSVMMPLGMVIWGPLSDVVKIDFIFIGTGIAIFLTGLIVVFDKTIVKAGSEVTNIENKYH